MSMFPYIKNMIFSKILYFFLFPAVLFPSCRQGMTAAAHPLKPVFVSGRIFLILPSRRGTGDTASAANTRLRYGKASQEFDIY